MHRLILIVLCFIFSFAGAADDPDHISVDCGGGAALSGGRWHGDVYTAAAAPKGGQSSTVTGGEVITAVDPVPYKTARISRSQFSYSFHLNPGQKFIRLHFNPVSYHAFEGFNDFFTVEAGPFTLLANFSASLTARALALNILVKEFCLITQANQTLNIVFSPETSQSKHNYAFINGIEIISVPSTVAYCHGGNSGIHVLGQKSVIYVDNTSALERVYHHNMKWGSVLDDFGMWASNLKGNAKKASNLSWRVCVDVGFRYLVRIHLCELGLKMDDFVLLIDDMIALTSADMLQQGGNQSILWFNYMVMVEGHKREGRRSISISLNSQRGPLEGFEVFKLSNHDRTLASPNPTGDGAGDSPPQTIQTLLRSLLGRRNAVATVVFTMICLVNIIVHLLHKMWGTNFTEEENMPSARGKQLCRPFSLAEIQSATDYFHEASVLGKGGFGKVYKGFIDNRREIVAIKRSKLDSKHGEHQFWAEVDTLSELRHVNLVSLIGYCREQQEMILVYEFMPCGSLADHLYKIARKGNAFHPLSWKQRLKICIGAGRALDYLHTGHGIIHRDVKSSNILLDHKLVAKVSDFGLAKTGSGGSQSQSEYSTNLKGTPGYIDPNYHRTCKLTKKSDTYSFGVVLLEVLCGRKAVEKWHEEDERILKTWAIDNISKGQVADIVAPSLRGEISPDSLKTFVKVAERCLHDEPKKRPAIAHVLIKLELALQQQEKAESLDTKERTGGEDFISSSDNSKKENMSFMVPNEKINAADAMPQMDNARSSALNEIRNVTDAMPCADNDKTKLSVNPRPMMSSCNVQTDMSMLREQSTNTMIISGRKDVRKSMMLRISQIIWPWKNKKPSNKTDVVGVAVSAPVSHRTSNITLSGNTISDKRTDGMILTPTLRIFSFEEVNTATRNFSEDSVLKEGGFGKLYKGWIHENSSSKKRSGSVVAIKKLNHESTQEFKQWQSEVNFLGRLSHPNLVKLLGYGWEDEVLFLVYECMPCGTLADHLYKLARKSNDFYPLSWRQRLKICIGVGRALDYLHAGHGIIHLNVKASNIVLDEKFGAKLSDFSLAVNGSGSESQSQDSTNLIGTFGCTDPNYLKTRKPTLKSDTYSFGVVLLEVLCGRQAVEPWNDEDKCSLTTWAIDNISSGQVDDIVAPSLRGEISPDSLKTFVKVAETCLHDEPKKRPSTAHVITKLELALQQQEKAESLPPNERTSVREVLSPTDKSQKEKINFMVASEKTNVADIVSPSLGGQMLPQPSVRSFTFSELKAATRNFRSEAVLGVGGFGVVYKGWINEKCSGKDGSETPIAVKKLNSGSTQGFDEWQSEIEFLGRISHPNLVKLLGYCLEDKELILVYEFMPKGSLDNHLFRSRQPLPWDIRLKILIGAARGMAFLHASEGQVIYRDFKPSNILLDESYHAKLSDFGLAKMGPTDGHSHVTTRIMGTHGYAAPEYVATGHLYVKSDVYGFGVVLVEMLTGLRALDTRRPAGQHNLVDWMKPHLSKKKKLQHVIDKHLVGTYPAKSAAQLAQLAFKCLENEPRNRPSMQEVVQTLETIADRPAQRRVHFSH